MPVFGPQLPTDSRQVVRGLDENDQLIFGQVGVEELIYTGRYGAIANSSTANSIAIGDHYFTLDVDDGKFRVGDDILITSLDDPDCFMWGEVTGKDTVAEPVRLRVYVDDISDITNGETSNWELQVVARPKPGIEKDVSTSSVDPTGAGPFTFTATAGKFFPLGGKLLLKPTTDRSIALIGKVKMYSSTTLIVDKVSTNATVPQSYTSWAIALLDAPQDALPMQAIHGLKVDIISPSTVSIDAGSIRDSTNTVNLTLPVSGNRDLTAVWTFGDTGGMAVKTGNLAGTVSSAGTAVTGTGTTFTTSFGTLPTLTGFSVTGSSIITQGTTTRPVVLVTNNTSLTTSGNLGAAAGSSYQRGGAYDTILGADQMYGIGVCRRDSDGAVTTFATALTADGVPDLPTGCTYYRLLVIVTVNNFTATFNDDPFYSELRGVISDLTSHVNDTVDAHDATAISYAGGTGISATTVEAAIDELATEKMNLGNLRFTRTDVTLDAGGGVPYTTDWLRVDTAGGAATDDMDDIDNGTDGDICLVSSADSTHDVTIRNAGGGTGNIRTRDGLSLVLSTANIFVIFLRVGSVWREISRNA